MAFNKKFEPKELKEENVAAFLKDAVTRLNEVSEKDIKDFEMIKKLIKKNVPLTRRKYVFASLIKRAALNYKPHFEKTDRKESKAKFEKKDNAEPKAERTPRITISEEDAATIFVGVGKNRNVYPRDLIGLLVSVAELDRSRIGDIHVLSNYSFIQLYSEDAQKVISKLNGYSYRGRKLLVSYSTKKEDAPQTETETQDDSIPQNVSNEGHADTTINTEAAAIQAEQNAFAQAMENEAIPTPVPEHAEPKPQEVIEPYSSTEDDGQVKSHFGDGAAY